MNSNFLQIGEGHCYYCHQNFTGDFIEHFKKNYKKGETKSLCTSACKLLRQRFVVRTPEEKITGFMNKEVLNNSPAIFYPSKSNFTKDEHYIEVEIKIIKK